VSGYQLQARRRLTAAAGRRREQTMLVEADSRAAADRIADELAGGGYTVWIFERTARCGLTAATHRLHLLRTVAPHPAADARRIPPARRPYRDLDQDAAG
jgi:hypothetical protein